MTVSRDRRAVTAARAASLAVLAALAGAPVSAQDVPAAPVAAPAQPLSILPPTLPAADPAIVGDDLAEPTEPAIAMDSLDAPSIDRIGLMGPAAGGFGADMWRGTDLELLKMLLPQLPRRMDSLAQRRIARSLLLSAAS